MGKCVLYTPWNDIPDNVVASSIFITRTFKKDEKHQKTLCGR